MTDVLSHMAMHGFLSTAEVVSINRLSVKFDESTVRVMRSLAILSSQDIQTFVSTQMGISKVTDVLLEAIDFTYAALIPVDIATNYCVFAFGETPTHLHVAMEDPFDRRVLHALEFFLERRIVPAIATIEQLSTGLQKIYQLPIDSFKFDTIIEESRGLSVTKNAENRIPSYTLIEPKFVAIQDDAIALKTLKFLDETSDTGSSEKIHIDFRQTRLVLNSLLTKLHKEENIVSAIGLANSVFEQDQVALVLNSRNEIECQTLLENFQFFPILATNITAATSVILTPIFKIFSKLPYSEV